MKTVQLNWKNKHEIPANFFLENGNQLLFKKNDYDSLLRVYVLVNGIETPITYSQFGEEHEYTTHFESKEQLQKFVNNNELFVISQGTFNDFLLSHYKERVLPYYLMEKPNGNKVIVSCNTKKSDIFVVIGSYSKYLELDSFKGKTVEQAQDLVYKALDKEEDDYYTGMAQAYYGTSSCSNCGDGGCVHCSPKDFL